MEVLFFGICTHLVGAVEGVEHRVALPASHDFKVLDPHTRAELAIPPHTPLLALRREDILSDDAAIDAFAGPDLQRTGTGVQWSVKQLRTVIFDFAGLGDDGLQGRVEGLPHLSNERVGVGLDNGIREGEALSTVSAFIDVSQGRLEVVRDSDKHEGRHVVLRAATAQPWQLRVKGGAPNEPSRALMLASEARLTFSNAAPDEGNPCSANDYLLHYRVTNRSFVPANDFALPFGTTAAEFPLTGFPGVPLQGSIDEDSSTLANCSNSAWP